MNVAENDNKHGYSKNVFPTNEWVSFFMADHTRHFTYRVPPGVTNSIHMHENIYYETRVFVHFATDFQGCKNFFVLLCIFLGIVGFTF